MNTIELIQGTWSDFGGYSINDVKYVGEEQESLVEEARQMAYSTGRKIEEVLAHIIAPIDHITVNTAQLIELESLKNASTALDSASSLAVSVDQDWENEATIYNFADGSTLLVSGPSFCALRDKN